MYGSRRAWGWDPPALLAHWKPYGGARSARRHRNVDELLQSSPPTSGDEQPVSYGGMACRHGQDRGGEDCRYAASLGQRKRVAHIPTADANAAAGSCLISKDKRRRDPTLTSSIHGPSSGVHFNCVGSGPQWAALRIG